MQRLLLLLAAITLASCNRQENISVNWVDDRAVSVTIPTSDPVVVSVDGSEFNVLGTIDVTNGETTFTPAVPFERGQTYKVTCAGKHYSFTIPTNPASSAPRLVASYPSCETVPENLLKIYLQFDQPMVEGKSSQYVVLWDETTRDTVRGAFLDLQPELWNEDQTVLTLWLDPGRIKRDLIPNKTLGAVLVKDHIYKLSVSPLWRSKDGIPLDSSYVRKFLTVGRDAGKPDVATWIVSASKSHVMIDLHESLDWSLLGSVFTLRTGDEKIAVTISTNECERQISLIPVEMLQAGEYTIEVESRLEDLAGNNLNRLFETDVTDGDHLSDEKFFHTLTFVVR
jgi:hypothetical protein